MLALLGAICFLLALVGLELGDLGEEGFLYLGLFLVALELAFGSYLPFPRRNRT